MSPDIFIGSMKMKNPGKKAFTLIGNKVSHLGYCSYVSAIIRRSVKTLL
jgi:hypothetical protein